MNSIVPNISSAPDVILRLPDVERASGLKRSQIYELIDQGAFPAPIKLGGRAVGWLQREMTAWQQKRIAERDAVAA